MLTTKVYLHLLKKTAAGRYYFTAYQHTPEGLVALWPTDGPDMGAEKAKREGFHYSGSKRECEVAFNIMVEAEGTDEWKLAAINVQKILRNQGQDVTNVEIYAMYGRMPQRVD